MLFVCLCWGSITPQRCFIYGSHQNRCSAVGSCLCHISPQKKRRGVRNQRCTLSSLLPRFKYFTSREAERVNGILMRYMIFSERSRWNGKIHICAVFRTPQERALLGNLSTGVTSASDHCLRVDTHFHSTTPTPNLLQYRPIWCLLRLVAQRMYRKNPAA